MSAAGRRWLELAVRCRDDDRAAESLVEGLLALGGRAAEERDGWLVTHVTVPSEAAAPAEFEGYLANARAALGMASGCDAIELRAEWREHEDWAETWKRGLAPRQVTERILVRPSWTESPPTSTGVTIVIDPGMAFGTAEHGTTRGSLRLLDGAVRPGDRVLDVGAGSGILAIAAAGLGAAGVVAIEPDEFSCEALVENVERNGVQDRVSCLRHRVTPDDLAAYGPVSGIVANIESGVLVPLMSGFARALSPGGWLIVSGILDHEWPGLLAAAERADFRFVSLDADGEWRSGRFERA
jgi:ribosomal protein L11 methyltransferase